MVDLRQVNVADGFDNGLEDCLVFFLGLVGPTAFDPLALHILLDEVVQFAGPGWRDHVRSCFDDWRRQRLVAGTVTRVTAVTTLGSNFCKRDCFRGSSCC